MIRPSVNQITSAYTGRMPALQEQVEKDKQANNGIPSDLRKLMALQDLLSDGKHMGIDQALKAPQNPATVSQSLQDRARQILQARMAQAQQSNAIAQKQQEAMVNQGRPGPVPQGIAQPERQPEGIDQLESNVGESYANGGIVAFDGTKGSEVEDKDKEKKAKPTTGSYLGRSEGKNLLPDRSGYEGMGIGEFLSTIGSEGMAKLKSVFSQDESLANKMRLPTLSEKVAKNMAEVNKKDPNITNEVLERIGLATRADQMPQQVIGQKEAPPPAAPPKPQITKTTDKPSIANLPAVADLLPPALPTPEKGSPRDVMGKSMTLDPDAEMNRILAAREKLVGAPDTSQYQALIEELRGQKAKLQKKPEPGFESLMEYFGEIAAGPTVGRSGKAGAMASERLRQRELDKEKQANALSERMIEAAQKQQDAIYGYKKEGFALSEGERARVFKERFDAAKAAGESDDRARQMAQQAVLEREKMKQQAELERERNAVTIRAAGIGAANRRGELMELAESLIKDDKTGKLTLEAALEKAARIKGTVATAGQNVKSLADYQKAKKEIEALYPPHMREGTGKTAVAQKKLYDAAMAELQRDYGMTQGAGLNSLPATNAGVKILSIEPSPK